MTVFETAQQIALALDPDLTGDQLDRIGNIVVFQSDDDLEKVTAAMLLRAIFLVKTILMEK